MGRKNCRGKERGPIRRRGVRPGSDPFLAQHARTPAVEQADDDDVQDEIRDVETERGEPPQRAVDGEGKREDGTRRVVQQRRSPVPRLDQRFVEEDRLAVVEDERIVEAVLIDERRNRAGQQAQRGSQRSRP